MFEFRQFMPGVMIIFPIIFMVFFIIRLLLNRNRSDSSGAKLTGLSENENNLFFGCTPRRYWKKAPLYFDRSPLSENEIKDDVKSDPIEALIQKYSSGEITIEEYEERVRKLV